MTLSKPAAAWATALRRLATTRAAWLLALWLLVGALGGQTAAAQDTISTADIQFTPAEASPAPAAKATAAAVAPPLASPSASAASRPTPVAAAAAPTRPKPADTSLWVTFLAGLLGGFAAILMPCIFPLMPMTVSFFTKRSGTRAQGIRNALVYGLSIIVIYVALGLLITVIFGADALNNLATNGLFNFFFFVLLLVFAASFLGAFEIMLPTSWANKMDEKADQGGLLSIFFMAATLALVSFSCTGPIIGTLLVQAASMGQLLGPAVGMFGFALALALPFTLFSLFPSWLSSLPKSGNWLNSVKVSLGFLELALALKFLSNVDLAYHWEWFDREVFLSLWIVIFAMLGCYLLGKIRFSHDGSPAQVEVEHNSILPSKRPTRNRPLRIRRPVPVPPKFNQQFTLRYDDKFPSLSLPRLFMAIIVLAFTVYLVPGLWGAPLKAVSAFLPPQDTQDFDLYTPSLLALPGGSASAPAAAAAPRKYASLFRAPLGLPAFFDYDEGMAYAKQVNKPVLIDFTGHACVNCRKMEATVWPDKQVLPLLRDKYVLIQLYVDDKTELPAAEQTVSTYSGKQLKTIGNKWSDFQASRYNANSQPFYVLLGRDAKLLATPEGADYDPANFVRLLNNGLKAY